MCVTMMLTISFCCSMSNNAISVLSSNIRWSYKGNCIHVPVDSQSDSIINEYCLLIHTYDMLLGNQSYIVSITLFDIHHHVHNGQIIIKRDTKHCDVAKWCT